MSNNYTQKSWQRKKNFIPLQRKFYTKMLATSLVSNIIKKIKNCKKYQINPTNSHSG